MKLLSVLAVTVLYLTGCDVADSGCLSDSECRFGRTCQSGICVGYPSGANNGNNVNTNNTTSTNNQNNTPTNNQNNVTNNQNNVPSCDSDICYNGCFSDCEPCEGAHECEDGFVCSNPAIDTGAVNRCAVGDRCVFTGQLGNGCRGSWDCERAGTFDLLCDPIALECTCFRNMEPIRTFADSSFCGEVDIGTDLINIQCGTSIDLVF